MLEEITHDEVNKVRASNQPMFNSDIDFEELEAHRQEVIQKWKNLPREQKLNFENQQEFERQNHVRDLKDPNLIPARNFSLLRKEVEARLNASEMNQILPIDSLDYEESVIEISESIENVNEIKNLYKLRKKTVGNTKNAGISSDEAQRLKNCFTQGRELYLSGKTGSLMVKPLNFFYALTAYTYGVIILNNPLRYRKDMLPGSHGMSYLPETIRAQFGGDSPRGTFSDLVTAFPTHHIKTSSIDFNIDCTHSILEFYTNRFDVSLGTLLSMVPEMIDYYKLTTGRRSRCYPLEISNANDPKHVKWEFHIGDGETKPSSSSIEQSFPEFSYNDRHGKIVVEVRAADAARIKACIYTDIRGKLWYIENPFFPIILPEIAIHFLISSMYSNIMRYRPDEWGSMLRNDVSSEISLLTRHYFSSFQKKFMLIVLRSITKYFPYAA